MRLQSLALGMHWDVGLCHCETLDMNSNCPLCGGKMGSLEQCRERFDACLAYEYEQPSSYGAVHHLTVICYMLQHNAYTVGAWWEARSMLVRCMREDRTPQQTRRQDQARSGNRRRGSITRGARLERFDDIHWTSTIADVRTGAPEPYCDDVRRWAASLIEDTELLARTRAVSSRRRS